MNGDERIENGENIEDIDIKKVSDIARVSEERIVIKGYKVRLETLTVGEEDLVLRELTDEMNTIERFHHVQKWTLIYATKKLNGEEITDQNRKKVMKLYLNIQTKLLSEFYKFYLELAGKQNAIIEDLKKK